MSPICYQKSKVEQTVYLLLIYLQPVIHETFNCRETNRVQDCFFEVLVAFAAAVVVVIFANKAP